MYRRELEVLNLQPPSGSQRAAI